MSPTNNPYDPPRWPHGDRYPDVPWIGGGPPRRVRSVWSDIGVAIAVLAAIFGFLVVGLFVLFAISLNSWGNNK